MQSKRTDTNEILPANIYSRHALICVLRKKKTKVDRTGGGSTRFSERWALNGKIDTRQQYRIAPMPEALNFRSHRADRNDEIKSDRNKLIPRRRELISELFIGLRTVAANRIRVDVIDVDSRLRTPRSRFHRTRSYRGRYDLLIHDRRQRGSTVESSRLNRAVNSPRSARRARPNARSILTSSMRGREIREYQTAWRMATDPSSTRQGVRAVATTTTDPHQNEKRALAARGAAGALAVSVVALVIQSAATGTPTWGYFTNPAGESQLDVRDRFY